MDFPFENLGVDTTQSLVVSASHILARHAVLDAFGHVSARHPHDSQRFIMGRQRPPALLGLADLLLLNMEGEICDGAGGSAFIERYIHSAIYARRPDVNAIVHSHSPATIPFGVAPATPIRPICHMCGFLGAGAPVFDIRTAAGEGSDLLIRTPGLGDALAASLGQGAVVLMRGHGSTVVGHSVQAAVYRAIYLDVNAGLQLQSMPLGPVTYLSDGEASATQGNEDLQIKRAWELWHAELPAHRG